MKPSQVLKSKLEKIEYETISEKRLRGIKNNMRDKISKILVKWSMPTRQAAISELVFLFQSEMKQIVKESKPERLVEDGGEAGSFWNSALDEYESNLINTIEEGK